MSTQLLITTAFLNIIAWIFSYLAVNTIYNVSSVPLDIYFLYSDSALFLKELVFFFYIAFKSVKINTLSDELCNVLSKSDWLTDGTIEKDHLRLSLYVSTSFDPVEFKILTRKISTADIYAYVIGLITAAVGKLIQTAIRTASE